MRAILLVSSPRVREPESSPACMIRGPLIAAASLRALVLLALVVQLVAVAAGVRDRLSVSVQEKREACGCVPVSLASKVLGLLRATPGAAHQSLLLP